MPYDPCISAPLPTLRAMNLVCTVQHWSTRFSESEQVSVALLKPRSWRGKSSESGVEAEIAARKIWNPAREPDRRRAPVSVTPGRRRSNGTECVTSHAAAAGRPAAPVGCSSSTAKANLEMPEAPDKEPCPAGIGLNLGKALTKELAL